MAVFRSPDRVADDMIEVVPSTWDGHGARLRLRPPRALSRRQFILLFAVLSGAMWIVAMLGWWGGNAFAPAFALLHSAILALALRALERGGERVSLASSGRQVQVGDFLGPAERRELADTLQDLLAAASGRNR